MHYLIVLIMMMIFNVVQCISIQYPLLEDNKIVKYNQFYIPLNSNHESLIKLHIDSGETGMQLLYILADTRTTPPVAIVPDTNNVVTVRLKYGDQWIRLPSKEVHVQNVYFKLYSLNNCTSCNFYFTRNTIYNLDKLPSARYRALLEPRQTLYFEWIGFLKPRNSHPINFIFDDIVSSNKNESFELYINAGSMPSRERSIVKRTITSTNSNITIEIAPPTKVGPWRFFVIADSIGNSSFSFTINRPSVIVSWTRTPVFIFSVTGGVFLLFIFIAFTVVVIRNKKQGRRENAKARILQHNRQRRLWNPFSHSFIASLNSEQEEEENIDRYSGL
jgi:hypothetical protein